MEITEPLTWDQICARYPDQHVYLVEMDWVLPRGSGAFHTARVIGHSADGDVALEAALAWLGNSKTVITRRYTAPFTGLFIRPTMIIDDELRDEIRARR
jgi:hypothetical protein